MNDRSLRSIQQQENERTDSDNAENKFLERKPDDNRVIRIVELFAGIGNFRLGAERANIGVGRNRQENICLSERQEAKHSTGDNNSQTQRPDGCTEYPTHPFRVVWANEIDPYACQIYRKNYGDKELFEGDIRTVPTSAIPDCDLIMAGFPCQSFSVAGQRGGFEDTRGTLFFEVARIAKDKRPRFILLENVPGLLSAAYQVGTGFYTATKGEGKGEITSDNGRVKNEPERGWEEITIPVAHGYCFNEILITLQELGYNFTEWGILNSKDYGVPQNRERVFIIGHLREGSARTVLHFGASGKQASEFQGLLSSTITAKQGGAETNGTYIVDGDESSKGLIELIPSESQAERVYDPQGLATTLASEGGGLGAKTGLYAVPCLTPDRLNKRQNGRRFKEDGDPMFTLTGQDIHGVVVNQVGCIGEDSQSNRVYDPEGLSPTLLSGERANSEGSVQSPKILTLQTANCLDKDCYLRTGERPRDENGKPQLVPIGRRRIRKLTPKECCRLQADPDNWTEGVSETQQYKMLGNAVTVSVIETLCKWILEVYDS